MALFLSESLGETGESTSSQALAVMSHELRSPLNAIRGYSDLLLMFDRDALGTDVALRVERIRDNADHLASLVEDLLDLARLDARGLRAFAEDVKTEVLVERCHDLLARKVGVSKCSCLLEIDPALPPMMTVDSRLLSRTIDHLVSNAVKFAPQGDVSLKLGWRADGYLEILISDTGIGMSEHTLRYIFEPFWQADGSDGRSYGGLGVGLALVKEYVNLLDGHLVVASVVGQGTQVKVVVPVIKRG